MTYNMSIVALDDNYSPVAMPYFLDYFTVFTALFFMSMTNFPTHFNLLAIFAGILPIRLLTMRLLVQSWDEHLTCA